MISSVLASTSRCSAFSVLFSIVAAATAAAAAAAAAMIIMIIINRPLLAVRN